MNYYQYEPGNGTRYTLWSGALESPHSSECCNILVWRDPNKCTNTTFTFPKNREARVTDITKVLENKDVFEGDIAALIGFVREEMKIPVNDAEGYFSSSYDNRGRWVG